MRRMIAMLLAVVMLAGNVPFQAFATEAEPQETQACVTEGCTYGAGHSGECSTFVACDQDGCIYAAGHEGNCSNFVAAEEPKVEAAADAAVYVTVSNRGGLGMAYEEVTVSDRNRDGRLTVDEALYAAHSACGKAYASENGTVTKLWNEETSNVSFFLNHRSVSAAVTEETVSSGDYLVASVDQDTVNDYDKYSRFDVMEKSVSAGNEFTLTLTDDAGNALAGMGIGLWDGNGSTTMTGLTTDVDGSVPLMLDQEGLYCLTAKGTVVESSIDVNTMEMTSIETPIIAPACVVTVAGAAPQELAVVYMESAVAEASSPVMYAAADSGVSTMAEGGTELTVSGGSITMAPGTTLASATLTNISVYKQGAYQSYPTITGAIQNGTTIDVTLADTTDPSYPLQVGFGCSSGALKQSGNTCTLVSGQGTMVVKLELYPGFGAPSPIGTATYTINFTIPMGTAYTVTPPTGEGFAFTGKDSVYEGKDYTFSVSLNEGYDGTNLAVKVNGETVTGDNGTYTVSSVSGDLTITVEGVVRKEQYAVTLTTGEGYTIASDDIPYKGEDYTFTVTADAVNYKADTMQVLLDGESMTGENGIYTIPGLAADHVVTVTIDKKAEYTVIKNTMAGVTITGPDTVLETDPYTFSIAVDGAYDSTNMVVKVNGEEVTLTDGSHTITAAGEDITITVECVVEKVIHTVTLTEGTGYTISGQETSYAGEPYTFTVTVDDSVYFADQITVKVDGKEVILSDGKYTFAALDGDKIVTVDNVVERQLFTVTKPEVEGVTFTGADNVREGKSYSFSIAVDSAYDSANMVVTVNDTAVTLTDGSYTIESASENVVVAVTGVVKKQVCTITLPTGKGYTVSGALTAYKGDSYTFTVTVAAGYVGDALVVTANGETVSGSNGSYTITVEGDTEIAVTGVEREPLPEKELTVADNVIDITDKTVYSLSSYYAKAVNIAVSGATVKKAYEDNTTIYILLPSNTADDAQIGVTFGTALNRCSMSGTTESLTLSEGDGALRMTLKGQYSTLASRSGTATYDLIFIREAAATEVPVRIQETDSAEMYRGKSITLNLDDYFTGEETYYLVESAGNTPVAMEYSFAPEAAGIYTLVFGAANSVGNCPDHVTVTVTVKDIEGGVWIGHTTSNGTLNYVMFTDADGNPIEGIDVSYADCKIRATLPKTYDANGRITAAFDLTQNSSGLPFITTSNQAVGSSTAAKNKFTAKTTTLSNGAGTLTFYLYNAEPKVTSNSYTTFTVTYAVKNDLPVLAEGAPATAEATITAGQAYTLNLSSLFTDADGDSLTYLVSVDGAAAVAAEASYSYTTNTAGTYTLVFTANDGKGTSTVSHTVTLTVENSTDTSSMTVSLPEGLKPKFYVSNGFGEDGIETQGDEVTVTENETGYTVTYPANAEMLSVRAENWGGMAFAAEANGSVTLRQVQMNVVDYDDNAAESTNTVTYDGHTAQAGTEGWLLVTGAEYTYTAVPKDSSLTTASVTQTLQPGEDVYTLKAVLGIYNPIAITVPTGAKAQLYNYNTGKYYVATELEAKIVKDNGDGTTTYSFVGDTKASGTCFIYRVSKPGKITKAGYLAWGKQNVTVTYTDADKANTYRLDDYSTTGQSNSGMAEDSVLLNINSRNHLAMNVGETKTLKAYRAWELIKISYQNYIITPDFTYNILSGNDVVRLTEVDSPSVGEGDWKKLETIGTGTAVIEVTYDAMEVSGGSYDGIYGASDPARTGLVIVQVGGNDASVDFGIDCFASRGSRGSANITYNPNNKRAWDAEFDTLYFTGNGGELKLSPSASGTITQVAVSYNKGASWQALTAQDGVYTAPIVSGNNILRVSTEAGVAYQVVRGDKVNVQITEQTGDGDGKMEPGETVRVALKGLHMPIPKMAGNYNPGFGSNSDGYSSVHLNYTANGQAVHGPGAQYNFITAANYLDIIIPEDIQTDHLTLTDGYIGVGILGLTQFDVGGDSHRNIPDKGCNTRDSETTFHTRSILPEVTISLEGIRVPVPVAGVALDKTELTMNVGDTQTLTATVTPEHADNKTVTWSADPLTVVAVDNGVITARSAGTATITATAGEKNAVCTVTVQEIPKAVADVYLSVSHDAGFLTTDTGKVMALQKVRVPYFDLTPYGLGDFNLPQSHADYGKPTMLHLYIYATELFRYGISAEEAGKGDLKDEIGSPVFAYSGAPGSICMDQFWGMDMNLNYYHNYVFPADESGYGITADRVVLKDGDIVTIGHFTSWSFFGDSTSIFNYLAADGDTVVTTAAQNDVLNLQVYRAGPSLGTGGSNTQVEAVRDIYYGKAGELSSGDVTSWTRLGTTDATGKLAADISELPVGQYILAVAGQKGAEYPDDIVSTPGGIVLNVTESTLDVTVQKVVNQIKAIGEVTLDREEAIAAARAAYDALTQEQKLQVTNADTLTAAEEKLAALKADKAVADAVAAKIEAIGEVTLDSEAAIAAARTAYDALTEDQKTLVTNLQVLTDAENKLEALQVMQKIDAIGEVTLDSEAAVAAARTAYDALTEAQKTQVTNVDTLTAAEAILEALKAEKTNKEEAKKVIDLIEALDETITEDSEDDITAARAAYETLTDDQKAYVTNYDDLLAAEEELRYLKLSNADIARVYRAIGDNLAGMEALGVGSVNGEWRVIGLKRGGRAVPDAYYDTVVAYVRENMDASERLHGAKSSDNSRIILALTALGKDVTNVGGHNLLSGLNEMNYIRNQGINGVIWALIAFDSHDYPTPEGITREDLVNAILAARLSDGGWALAGQVSDPDMTGMALQALAPYYSSNPQVKSAVDAALTMLSEKQNVDGTFTGSEGTTCESLAQVITGLTALGINPETDERFVKNTVSALDALAAFYDGSGGFRHGLSTERNMMATEQGYYALVSYFRFLENKTSLYDMSDVTIETSAANQAAASNVIGLINAIGTVDLTKEERIVAARTAYDALTDAQKALVTNYKTLTDAETDYANLTKTAEDEAKADAVDALIQAIGTVNLTKEDAIDAARRAYNGLTTVQKALVDNYATLTAAEARLAELKDQAAADAVKQKIDSIGSSITLGSETKIKDARNAYDKLTAAQKALVSNYQALIKAEEALNKLKSTVSVTFSLLGCYKHGTGETTVHTLADGNLQTWIDAKTYYVQPGSTVKDLLEQALAAANMTPVYNNQTKNYVEAIIRNGVTIGEFTNGSKSGWMYTLNGKHPGLGVNQQTLVSGDKVVFHYSDDFTREEGSSSGSTGVTTTGTTTGTVSGYTNYITATTTTVNTETAESVDRLIEDIGEEITLESEAGILAARAAYDKLTEEQKTLVEKYDLLVAAEAKLAELKGASGEGENVYMVTGDYIQGLGTPGVGNVGGEWMVIGLARSGRSVPPGYYDHVLNYVRENINEKEQLHGAKSSDNSRLILALTAIGKDVTHVDGHNLLQGLNDMDYIQKQGINGPIWALMAFDSGNYPVPEGNVSREKLIAVILKAQLSDGGWALSGERSDPDMTGMAIQALAPYMESRLDVQKAVEAAIWTLSKLQNDNGSFSSVDGPNSESISQVIVALAALGIDADTDARFVKNGISAMDALLTYYIPGGGFRHILDGNLDGMSTEQAFYALVAYERMKQNQNFLYDMTDVVDAGGDVIVEETTEPAEAPTEPVEEKEEEAGNDVVIWTGVMSICAAAIAVLLLNRKRLFGKF